MAHIGYEFGFGPVRHFGLPLGIDQFNLAILVICHVVIDADMTAFGCWPDSTLYPAPIPHLMGRMT